MAYYIFKSCPIEKLDDIGGLCEQEGLQEAKGHATAGIREWGSHDHPKLCVVQHTPESPLIIQTYGTISPTDPDMIAFVRQLVRITNVNEIYTHWSHKGVPYDMSLFQ